MKFLLFKDLAAWLADVLSRIVMFLDGIVGKLDAYVGEDGDSDD